jgi:GT2 family glycosyltransferase
MKIAAITITYNRLELTKQTINSFYSKTNVDYHVFIDNGSTDGTKEYLKQFPHIFFEKNVGIAAAFSMAMLQLNDYDFILKLDNDIEVVTDNIIEKMLNFYELNGINYVCSPVDLNLDKRYRPSSLGKYNLSGYNAEFTTHTGGAFQMIPFRICELLCKEFQHFKLGDYMIGKFYRQNKFKPTYLIDLQMKHIGLNQTSPNYVL